MNQERIGKFIKDIRVKNNLTQKEFASRYGVTYQAVSKWENGKNIPDILLLKDIAKDFNVPIEDILNGESSDKKKKINFKYILIIVICIISFVCLFLYFKNKDDFELNSLTSSCKDFEITGVLAYNDNRSSIYISDIKYCGDEFLDKYSNAEFILYESNNDIDKKIDSYIYNDKYDTLDNILKNVNFNVGNYVRNCKEFSESSIYLLINAKAENGSTITHKINLNIEKVCPSK